MQYINGRVVTKVIEDKPAQSVLIVMPPMVVDEEPLPLKNAPDSHVMWFCSMGTSKSRSYNTLSPSS